MGVRRHGAKVVRKPLREPVRRTDRIISAARSIGPEHRRVALGDVRKNVTLVEFLREIVRGLACFGGADCGRRKNCGSWDGGSRRLLCRGRGRDCSEKCNDDRAHQTTSPTPQILSEAHVPFCANVVRAVPNFGTSISWLTVSI